MPPNAADQTVLHCPMLGSLPWMVHGFSTRRSRNLGYVKHDTPSNVDRNRARFLKTLGTPAWPLLTLRQVHSDVIHVIASPPAERLTGDGLITATPGLLLAVQSADCLPVVLADPEQRAVGIFHAGWRGTLRRIAEKGAGVMRAAFGSNPENMLAAVGPGIAACCYQVGEEVREKFEAQFAYASALFREEASRDEIRERYPLMFMNVRAPGHTEPAGKLHLDLHAANRRQLLDAGLRESNIETLALCTACRPDLFFSYRGEKGPTGRQMGVAGIRD